MSLDTKLDILGVALVLSSLALIFSSMSPNQGQLTGTINTFLAQNFGWGAIAVPLAMFAAGIWLILRHFGEEAPVLDLVRVIGVLMLYVGLLVLFQYIDSFSYDLRPDADYLEQLKNIFLPISYILGRGGGWIGAEIYYFLVANLTEIGGFFVLLAWIVVGLMLTLSLSAAELAIIIISVWRSFRDAQRRRAQRRAAMLAEQQGAAAQGLPGISVTRPAPDQLPSGRSPALPAPAAEGPSLSERSIPITQGGRTITASFRPGEPVAVERASGQPRTTPLPLDVQRARDDDEPAAAKTEGAKDSGPGNRLGSFAARMRQVVPGRGPRPQADGESAGATGSAAATASAKPASPLGRLTSAVSRVREALPGAHAAPVESGEKPAPASQDDAPAAAKPETPERSPYAPPPRPASEHPEAERERDAEEAVSFSSLLGSSSKPAAAPPPRPTPPRPVPATPLSGRLGRETPPSDRDEAAPARTDADARDRDTAPTIAMPAGHAAEPPAAETKPDTGDEARKPDTQDTEEKETGRSPLPPRPAVRPYSGPPPARPTPLRPAVPPPAPPARDKSEDEEEAADTELLRPARPKGVGPLPRPNLNNPFTRSGPPPRTPPGIPDASRAPTTSLQERLNMLRNRAPVEPEPEAEAAKEEIKAETPAPQSAVPDAGKPPVEREEASAPEGDATTAEDQPVAAPVKDDETVTAEERPAPRIVAMDENNNDLEDTPPAPAEAKDDRPPARVAAPPAPRAYQMPERPTPPPPPARSAAITSSTSSATPAQNGGGTPPPPQTPPRRTKFWKLPDYTELLAQGADQDLNHEQLLQRAKIIEETLASFGAPGRVVEVRTGPVITQFGVEPDYLPGRGGKKIRVKVSAIAQLDKDLQLALGAKSIRIEAPVPGKGYVGIEVPNDKATVVRLRDILDSAEFQKVKSPLGICLGQGVDGTPVAADLAAMPHLLIAGTTGSGKSVCVNAIIASLLVKNGPDRLKFIMVDPKRVELTGYNGIPHLVAPVVVELERIVSVLKWVTREMDERYKKFSSVGARNIEDYNKHLPQGEQAMPYIVVIIDELADLMMLAPDETERLITRIAALARATGIHLVIATQRPSVDVVTGLIKANFPARIAFAVASSMDSRVILDQPGADRLLGRGDMLYMSGDSPAPVRLQGVFVSDNEINNITNFWRSQVGPEDVTSRPLTAAFLAQDSGPASATSGWGSSRSGRVAAEQIAFWDQELRDGANNLENEDDEEDALYGEAVELVRRLNKASVSLLQRRLRIGYTRAARLIDMMEERGVVGPPTEGSKPREVLPEKH